MLIRDYIADVRVPGPNNGRMLATVRAPSEQVAKELFKNLYGHAAGDVSSVRLATMPELKLAGG
jgi:hypothetical protein